MPDLLIRNLPPELHARLKAAAAAHRRSLTQEAIQVIEDGLASAPRTDPRAEARVLPAPIPLRRPTDMEETLRFIDEGLERRASSLD